MNEPIWSPDPDGLERTRIAQLMKAVGRPIDPQRTDASIRDFVRWSQQEPQQFWPAVLDDLGVIWSKPYEQVVDLTVAMSGPIGLSRGRPVSGSTASMFPLSRCPINWR